MSSKSNQSPAADAPIELDIPDTVHEAAQSVEVLRAFVADGTLAVALNIGPFGSNVQDWGRVLAQIAHHAARASSLNGDMREHEALAAIRQSFERTFAANQPTMSGEVKGRVQH